MSLVLPAEEKRTQPPADLVSADPRRKLGTPNLVPGQAM